MSIEQVISNFEIKKSAKKHLVSEDNTLILHTDIAQALFNGQWKPSRYGLVQFAAIVLKIWEAHYADDPYADKCLLKISEEIKNTKIKFENYISLLHQQITGLRGFNINLFARPDPRQHVLKFATPYPYMASVLVEHVDYLNRFIYTLKRIGMAPVENLKPVDLMREVQRVYKLVLEWRYTGITRKDIIERNKKYDQVREYLGEVPLAILNREIKSIFLPSY